MSWLQKPHDREDEIWEVAKVREWIPKGRNRMQWGWTEWEAYELALVWMNLRALVMMIWKRPSDHAFDAVCAGVYCHYQKVRSQGERPRKDCAGGGSYDDVHDRARVAANEIGIDGGWMTSHAESDVWKVFPSDAGDDGGVAFG